MSWYFLRPQGPLLIGDGRSFEGGFYRGSQFPLPQVLLGAARARAGAALGFDWNWNTAPPEIADKVQRLVGSAEKPGSLEIRGVAFATRSPDGRIAISLPRPADVLVFPGDRPRDAARWHLLRPSRAAGVTVSAPHPLAAPLAPLAHRESGSDRKPVQDPPGQLGLNPFLSLVRAKDTTPLTISAGNDPFIDTRTHVVINPETLSASDGGLYAVGRLTFDSPFGVDVETGLAVEVEGADVDLSGPWRLGGKGGIVDVDRVVEPRADLDAVRSEALSAIDATGGRFRWILLTPGRFADGWLPPFIDRTGEGTFPGTDVRVRLQAAAVDRPLAYSGWDLAKDGLSPGRAKGAPRPTRLFAPAGAVYFFDVVDGGAPAARRVAEACWLKNLADRATWGSVADEAWKRAAAIDAACGLARGVFGPWEWHGDREGAL